METKHKGIVCPRCGLNSHDNYYGFTYVTDAVAHSHVKGMTPEGKLIVNSTPFRTHSDKNDRLQCVQCKHEFAVPGDVFDAIEWV